MELVGQDESVSLVLSVAKSQGLSGGCSFVLEKKFHLSFFLKQVQFCVKLYKEEIRFEMTFDSTVEINRFLICWFVFENIRSNFIFSFRKVLCNDSLVKIITYN
jgi:hypothetical protein